MVGILVSFWDGLFSGAFAVSFREDNTRESLVMVGDLGIGIGAKVLTALFLQVHDLRISRMALRTPGDDDVPKKGGVTMICS